MRRLAQMAVLTTAGLMAFQQPDWEALLDKARADWGRDITEVVEFRMEPLNPCHLKDKPDTATTQVEDLQTTWTFDDGSKVVEHSYRYIIRLNSNCDWSKIPVENVVKHEYGHVLLGGDYHSKNPKSSMFWLVDATQTITKEDRDALAAKYPAK